MVAEVCSSRRCFKMYHDSCTRRPKEGTQLHLWQDSALETSMRQFLCLHISAIVSGIGAKLTLAPWQRTAWYKKRKYRSNGVLWLLLQIFFVWLCQNTLTDREHETHRYMSMSMLSVETALELCWMNQEIVHITAETAASFLDILNSLPTGFILRWACGRFHRHFRQLSSYYKLDSKLLHHLHLYQACVFQMHPVLVFDWSNACEIYSNQISPTGDDIFCGGNSKSISCGSTDDLCAVLIEWSVSLLDTPSRAKIRNAFATIRAFLSCLSWMYHQSAVVSENSLLCKNWITSSNVKACCWKYAV